MRQEVIQKAPEQPKKQTPNLTGIPTQMKLDFERRSGLSFDDVRVHYNSDKPRKIGALAYTQIPQVHIGPGQERHLRHELGHVVQQKQGIVRPTTRIENLPINMEHELERHAELDRYQIHPYRDEHNVRLESQTIQCRFDGALAIIKSEKDFIELLSFYNLSDEDRKWAKGRFPFFNGNPVAYRTVSHLFAGKKGFDHEKLMDSIIENLSNFSGPATPIELTILRRRDSRKPKEIYDAGGFWGRNSGAIPVGHARLLCSKANIANLDWANQWKVQTASDAVPFVATGKDSQKAGNEYIIKVPLIFEDTKPGTKGKISGQLKFGTDTGDIETANIIALRLHGSSEEVLFLTGIPQRFIYIERKDADGKAQVISLEEYVKT